MALFEGIGRVSDYAQLNNLRREAKYRVKTGQSLVQAMGAPCRSAGRGSVRRRSQIQNATRSARA